MQEIEQTKGVWSSNTYEPNTRKCNANLKERIKSISECSQDFLDQWSHITGERKTGEITTTKDSDSKKLTKKLTTDLCLCGMRIDNAYLIVNDVNGNICQLGSTCIDRINPNLMKKYKKSIAKSGFCYICDKYFEDLEKHNNSKTFNRREYIGFVSKREKLLERLFEKLFTSRKCIESDCYNHIKKTEPEWKIRCVRCYSSRRFGNQ